MALRRRRPTRATPRNTYTEWWWPPSPTIFRTIPAGYTDFEQVMRPELEPGPGGAYLCAYQFRFVEGLDGYLGLQTEGGGAGKSAVFSIPDARGTPAFQSPRQVPYPWEVGRAYRLKVWTEEPRQWSASVREEQTGVETLIGHFDVPPDWRRLASWSRTSIEPLRSISRCGDLSPVRFSFAEPTADRRTVRPQLHQSRLGDGTCDGSSVDDVTGGVRHAMGSAF